MWCMWMRTYSLPTLFLSYRSQHYFLQLYPSSINVLYMCSIMMITISGLKIMQVKSLEYKLKVSLRTLSNHYIRLGRPARKGKSKLSLWKRVRRERRLNLMMTSSVFYLTFDWWLVSIFELFKLVKLLVMYFI